LSAPRYAFVFVVYRHFGYYAVKQQNANSEFLSCSENRNGIVFTRVSDILSPAMRTAALSASQQGKNSSDQREIYHRNGDIMRNRGFRGSANMRRHARIYLRKT